MEREGTGFIKGIAHARGVTGEICSILSADHTMPAVAGILRVGLGLGFSNSLSMEFSFLSYSSQLCSHMLPFAHSTNIY